MIKRIGIDIGGTFTDFTIQDPAGGITLWKEESTPESPVQAIETGLRNLSKEFGLENGDLLKETEQLVHGSTIATNTVIQKSGPKIGLVCTEGFRDIVYFRDGFKPERFNISLDHPGAFVDRHLRIGIPERIDRNGNELKPVDEEAVRQAARTFAEEGVAAVAVSLMWSILNPEHEIEVARILREENPDIHVINSHEVLPEIREWERTSATVLSAYVLPGISEYLSNLERVLESFGLQRPPLIMQINGGCASVGEILRRPVFALASGPAAAPAAASHYTRGLDAEGLITVDMGGTSFEACLIRDGQPQMSRTIQVHSQPIGVSGVEVHSVGAGGGSIAWVDAGGALRVGPQSAGARPGPSCYDNGGTDATVTDANAVLGYLAPDGLLGGRRTLDPELARKAIQAHVADRLGLDVEAAAAGVIEVVTAAMADAIRAVSVEKGIDPRNFLLVAAGGAGGLHATSIARSLGMNKVLLPEEAGVFCSFGMTVTDVRHDYSMSGHMITDSLDTEDLDEVFEELEAIGRQRLLDDGFSDDEIEYRRSVDARYPNQVHELTVDIDRVGSYTEDELRSLEDSFHKEHKRRFTYQLEDSPVECLHWRLSVFGKTEEVATGPGQPGSSAEAKPETRRKAYRPGVGMVEFDVYLGEKLEVGQKAVGPAIIQSPTTTVVLHADEQLEVRDDRSLFISWAD